jgi:Protein of unknown function (DUF2785)
MAAEKGEGASRGFDRMIRAALGAAVLMVAASASATPLSGCAPLGMGKAELEALKASEWAIADSDRRDAFLLALTGCTDATDPAFRDGIGFEATQAIVRKGGVSAATLLKLADELQSQLTEADPYGVRRPFAALNLAEIARADRISPFLTTEYRKGLVEVATHYMQSINDFRGFDPETGYRHAVAHASDLLMQLALNPALERSDLLQILDAIMSQAAPQTTSYITGESERLARPVFFVAQRQIFSQEEWNAWFAEIAGPSDLKSWDGYHLNPKAIAHRHNAQAFLQAVYFSADASDNPAYKPLVEASLAAIKMLP